MRHHHFQLEDLETRAMVLLESGSFLALRKEKGATCALYELFGHYVEVVVRRKMVKTIEIIEDSNRLALYVKNHAVELFFS